MTKDTYQIEIGKRTLEIKIKDWAEQASGSCLVRYGDTEVLATAVMSKEDREGIDFFPLTVEYEERYYAAGKIYGSRFIRRETRPTETAILTSRMIDRCIRPRFPEGLKKEVQVIITCLSWDGENDPDILGIIASSLALSISSIPWQGPISALRIAKIDKNWVFNPTYKERSESELELLIAGVENDKEISINMIEMESKEVSESEVLRASETALPFLKKIIDFQKEIVQKVGKEKIVFETSSLDPVLEKEMREFLGNELEKTIYQKEKEKRTEGLDELEKKLNSFIEEKYPSQGKFQYAKSFLIKEIDRLVHENIIKQERRPDDRKLDELRQISCQVGVLPRTHGSGLFCRGLTKTLSILTLGGPHDQQLLEGMEVVGKKRFIHHYNFPPYSVGEIKPMRGPGRREIGHGSLVEKSLFPLIPGLEEFPYTIRIVSEILSSNGSTSMASCTSASLALMDAGVPIKSPVAGIAMGLIFDKETKNYKILTDIQGPEDQNGDMDLKVAGTENGITAIQMDVKIDGISLKILKESLEGAKSTRMEILNKIKEIIKKPREKVSPFAPKIYTLSINPEKIGEVIGPRGSIIKKISTECEVTIDVEDSGLIYVAGENEELAKKALSKIKEITREVEIGEIFRGKVKRILNFGAFVEILPGQTGLVHISNLVPYQIRRVEDIIKIGDTLPVKVISIDELGRINLSAIEAGFQPKRKN